MTTTHRTDTFAGDASGPDEDAAPDQHPVEVECTLAAHRAQLAAISR